MTTVEWPFPQALDSDLPPVAPFSDAMLPESFRPWCRDIAERMQLPIDMPAAAAVVCLSGVVSRRAQIQPLAVDSSWVVVPNLWGGVVAPPGFKKSPVLSIVTHPLREIEEEWRREREAAVRQYLHAKEEAELRMSVWRELYKKAEKNGDPKPVRPDLELVEPKVRRLLMNDTTFEALHRVMVDNPLGVLAIRDELSGWWAELDQAGREGQRAFFLQCWSGDSSHTLDRIGRGNVYAEACCLSFFGGVQSGRLRSYLVDALDGPGDDGLVQRFQLLVWPDYDSDYTHIDRQPDLEAQARAGAVFRHLCCLDAPNDDGERPDDGGECPQVLPGDWSHVKPYKFAQDAQLLFTDWLVRLEERIRRGDENLALISHLSKFRSLVPSFSLLFCLADRACQLGGLIDYMPNELDLLRPLPVPVGYVEQAIEWAAYLESHARRVYSCVVSPEVRGARELAKHIQRGDLRNGEGNCCWFRARDAYMRGWSGLNRPDLVQSATDILIDAGWLKLETLGHEQTGGRPAARYLVNPAVLNGALGEPAVKDWARGWDG